MSVSGHEPRFHAMFREEAGPALDRLSRDLLALEHAGVDTQLVDSMFRDAHNLKGGAAMVGLEDVRRIAHAMEDLFEPLRRGAESATPELVDRLLAGVDGIRALLSLVVSTDSDVPKVDVDALEASLRGAARTPEPPDPAPAPDPKPVPDPKPRPDLKPQPSQPAEKAKPAATVQMPVARLDELVRVVGEGGGAQSRLGRYLQENLATDPAAIAEFRELSALLNQLQERTTRARMVPLTVLADSLQRVVRDLARKLGKQVRWEVSGAETELDRSLIDQLAGPLLHLVRNAVDHGIEVPEQRIAAGKPAEGRVRLHAVQLGPEVVITIADDGHGIDLDQVRDRAGNADTGDQDALYLIFRTGVSTATEVSDISGRGVGLDVVRANLEAMRGRIEVHSTPGQGTEFKVAVPVTLAVLRCLLVLAGQQRYALPLHTILTALPSRAADVSAEGLPVVWVGERTVPVSSLAETLGGPAGERGPAVVLTGLTRQRAFRVSQLLGQRDVVVKELSPLLPRLPVYIGTCAEADGSVLLVLDANGLIDRARAQLIGVDTPTVAEEAPGPRAARILVVDDAMTVRELQRSILERAGYTVLSASDGVDALAVAETTDLELVLTDVEMPRMDGFELTRALRAHPRHGGVGILVLTSLGTDEDRRTGLEAGADGYIVKKQFAEHTLLDAVERILGDHG
jgi:two-component system chemotaxis sensor kinase CheA